MLELFLVFLKFGPLVLGLWFAALAVLFNRWVTTDQMKQQLAHIERKRRLSELTGRSFRPDD